jgi:predicted HicB family RNase H-like nuclease
MTNSSDAEETNVSVRMPSKLKRRLTGEAKKQDLTLSQFVRKHMAKVVKMEPAK